MTQSGTVLALFFLLASPALAQRCTLSGVQVTCDDGRAGILDGEAIVWPDGTRSLRNPHPHVHIGKGAQIGPGVFVGSPSGQGMVPLDDPNAPNRRNCVILDDIPYCH